jgi:hypothetical protein
MTNEASSETEQSQSEEWAECVLGVRLPNGETLNVKSVTFDPNGSKRLILHCDFGGRYIRKAGRGR